MSQIYFLRGAGTGGAPFLTQSEIGFGDASNLLSSSPDLKFDNTELGLQNVVNVATSPGFVTGSEIIITMANGTSNGGAFGTDISFNIAGDVGSGQSAGVHVNTDLAATATVGVYTGIDVAPLTTANGATMDTFEGISIDGFQNNAVINNYYAYYGGGVSAGTGSIANQYGLYLNDMNLGVTNSYAVFTNLGKFHIGGLQAFANNAAAVGGGLVAGDLYYTNSGGDGIVKIVI